MENKEEIKKCIANIFLRTADALENNFMMEKRKIALTVLGTPEEEQNLSAGVRLCQKLYPEVDLTIIGRKIAPDLKTVTATSEKELYSVMEKMLDNKEISACVTRKYSFPIGVSSVGRIITPARGKEMLIASTSGIASSNRIEAMVKNAIYGIIVAKTLGNFNPTLGILNVDGSLTVKKILKDISSLGYSIKFAKSVRHGSDGIMRGNDLLTASPDVMVTDTLTGNILVKTFSAFQSGGEYETFGYGYGPGVGKNYDRNILIVSRSSGPRVIADSLKYAYEITTGDLQKKAKKEFEFLDRIDWMSCIKDNINKDFDSSYSIEREAVTREIVGVDVMEIDNAMNMLGKKNIYSEAGMGCTGPVITVSAKNEDVALNLLKKEGFIL